MNRGLLYEEKFTPQFSGHETFPLRYGWLKKVFDEVYRVELSGEPDKTREVFLTDDAIVRFGVGKNMVSSMRHWATCTNIIQEDKKTRNIMTTELAKTLLVEDGLDPWMENTSSIWTFHWHIAARSSKASYIWLFSHFNNTQFDRQMIVQQLIDLAEERGWKIPSPATIKRDVECLVRAYVSKPSKNDEFTEDQVESPLAELGIIQPVSGNEIFQIKRGYQPSLGDGAFLYALVDFWKRYTAEARTLSLEAISYEPGSPGRVFCMDENAVADRLYDIEKKSKGLLVWSETAGLRQISANKPLKDINALDLLKIDYNTKPQKKAA